VVVSVINLAICFADSDLQRKLTQTRNDIYSAKFIPADSSYRIVFIIAQYNTYSTNSLVR